MTFRVTTIDKYAKEALIKNINDESLKYFCNQYKKKVTRSLSKNELEEFTDLVRGRIHFINRNNLK